MVLEMPESTCEKKDSKLNWVKICNKKSNYIGIVRLTYFLHSSSNGSCKYEFHKSMRENTLASPMLPSTSWRVGIGYVVSWIYGSFLRNYRIIKNNQIALKLPQRDSPSNPIFQRFQHFLNSQALPLRVICIGVVHFLVYKSMSYSHRPLCLNRMFNNTLVTKTRIR